MAYDENIRIIAEELERVKNRPTGDKLPEVETTDEGKVLTVNSSGEWDAEELPDQLPEVESTDEGKVLTVNSSGEWAAANPSSPYDLDYSTTEKNTGRKWIDGKDIYCKTLTGQFPEITTTTTQTVGSVGSIDAIITAIQTIEIATHFYSTSLNVQISKASGEVRLVSVPSTYSEAYYDVSVYYTKSNTALTTETKRRK